MEGIKSQLLDVGFPCENFDESRSFMQAFDTGVINKDFIFIINWIGNEMSKVCFLENQFSQFSNKNNSESELPIFYIDIGSFLEELGWPVKVLMTGPFIDRYFDTQRKELLVSYLCMELKAAKMSFLKRLTQTLDPSEPKLKDPNNSIDNLNKLLFELTISFGENAVESENVLQNIKNKIEFLTTAKIIQKPNVRLLFTDHMTEAQWSTLKKLYEDMLHEFEIRRSLMLVRLELTLKSFFWKENAETYREQTKYFEELKSIDAKPSVKITDILVADEYLLLEGSSIKKNTNRTIYKTLIGTVPDRGGRPECHQPPPLELPPWQTNRTPDQRKIGHSVTKNKGPNFNKIPQQGGNRNNERTAKRYQPISNSSFHQDMMNEQYFGFSLRMPAGDNFHQYGLRSDPPITQFRGRGRPYKRYQARK